VKPDSFYLCLALIEKTGPVNLCRVWLIILLNSLAAAGNG